MVAAAYKKLNLPKDTVDLSKIKAAYAKLLKELHPDTSKTPNVEQLQEIRTAYQTLVSHISKPNTKTEKSEDVVELAGNSVRLAHNRRFLEYEVKYF